MPQIELLRGDCNEVMAAIPDSCIDSIITDPPYGLSFMGKKWDYDVPGVKTFKEMLRVLKPGGTALVFAGSRTSHRMAVNIEDAGFHIKDTIMWVYGSGFPKATDIAKNISKLIDNEKEKLYNCTLWNTQLNNVKYAEKIFLNDLIGAGLLTTSQDFVAENVIEFLRSRQLSASVSFVEKGWSGPNHILGDIFIVPEHVEVEQKQESLNVRIVDVCIGDLTAHSSVKIIFVPLDVRTYICERVENRIKEEEARKIGNGDVRLSSEMDINAFCADLINGLRHITLSQLKSIPTLDMQSITEKLIATNVIITPSIRECLTLSTENIVGRNLNARTTNGTVQICKKDGSGTITAPATPEAILWNGWKSHGLKPAYEPIIVAMKPNDGSYAENALKWGVSGLNIDGCRIGTEVMINQPAGNKAGGNSLNMSVIGMPENAEATISTGRFPANLIHDGSEEVVRLFPDNKGAYAPVKAGQKGWGGNIYGKFAQAGDDGASFHGDGLGSAARFFYCAKAPKSERAGSKHPTVKPLSLMEYLCNLTKTPTGGIVLDPFAGSGTTGVACHRTGRDCILIEREASYWPDIEKRIANPINEDAET